MPEHSHASVYGFYPKTRTVYEYLGSYYHGKTCLPDSDVITIIGDTFVKSYDRSMARIDQITRAEYHAEVQWECEFDEVILLLHSELKRHRVVRHSPLNTRDALYVGRTEALNFHNKKREGKGAYNVWT